MANILAAGLIALLGHEDYATREWATRTLIEQNNRHDHRTLIRRTLDTTEDCEVRRRCREVLEDYYDVGPLPRPEYVALDSAQWEECLAAGGYEEVYDESGRRAPSEQQEAGAMAAYVYRMLNRRPRAEVVEFVQAGRKAKFLADLKRIVKEIHDAL